MSLTTPVAITGMGAVTPLGQDVPALWDALCAGRCGIGALTRFDAEAFAVRRAGQVRGHAFDAEAGLANPAAAFLLAAAREAVCDAGLSDLSGLGLVTATNFGEAAAAERLLAACAEGRLPDPADVAAYGFAAGADRLAAALSAGGPRTVLSLSCASGTAALGYAGALIRAGRATTVLAAGYDALSRLAWSGLSALRTMTREEVRPFDKERSGTIFGEGAGAMVVESLPAARARGARVHALLPGWAANNNAFHLTAPAREGAGSAAVMAAALRDAGVEPAAVDHVNAHGTGTRYNDATETQALKRVLGPHASRITLTSIKSMTGHLMGAAGIVEAIATVLTLRDGVVPPTINYRTPDPECDLDVVGNRSRSCTATLALSNSAGIGGCNAAVVLARPGEDPA